MFTSAVRLSAAAVAAAILLGVYLYPRLFRHEANVTFGKVLENVAEAKTLHFRLMSHGQSGEIWARQPRQLRWDNPDGTYRIADGAKLWSVDEKANRATPGKSPYFRDQSGLDVLKLLELPDDQPRESLLSKGPAERVQRDGRDCLVYHMEIPAAAGKILIEALVEADTRHLLSLKTKTERNGQIKPVAELTVLAYDDPVAEEKFVVSDTLTVDGRIGKVTDLQGVVAVKPVMHQRWTPIHDRLLLKPGDWLRTDVRGANVVALRLVKSTSVILGPGTLVELVKPTQIRVSQGELEITAPANTTLELLGPDQQKITVKGKQHYRLQEGKLTKITKEPLWLKGFKGSTSNESLGSLVANVDGRNVPLSVGYHKVSVDIRDQIARTVIEESFVNHTDARLEGVFYFPLPQDASISGFGMWIGDNLVEADVVEKQRAREIYETILREYKDPGLLEWAGGNIFKARVFPIFAHAEKRIKITYTQVLPLVGNRYQYSYALQSELLQQHPLRELAIDIKVNSAVPLKGVTSPTHTVRLDQTDRSAHVEFSAQEYTPTRDFEVAIEVDGWQPELVVIPHRRGDDGYFMMELTPPATSSAADRDLLADGEPMHLLILADTSASMDAGQRSTQAALLASLLAALTPKDTINLAACDVDCDWVFEKPVPADSKNIMAARQFLAKRTSLGWTDLDKAFASAFRQSGPTTHVIYLGDGIVTTGDADPAAFAKRLRRLYEGKSGICHAVTTGNSFEPATVKAIAALGGGSYRRVTGEHGPQLVALELLDEIVQPPLRDLKVEFKGLRTARVYPEELPNLPPGTQQILLGRYLPEGRDQVGEVVVTGKQGDRTVRFTARVPLRDAELGNSFLPRLWARMHLDHLLELGISDAIKDEIIALSEEYQIITPYTSFLVLESDADRERFKVKRRFQVRDGERFFAEGRDNVNYELVQQQMKRAGNWRLGLRRTVLGQLATLGRDARMILAQLREERESDVAGTYFAPARASRISGLDLKNMSIRPMSALDDTLALPAPAGEPEDQDNATRLGSKEGKQESEASDKETSPDGEDDLAGKDVPAKAPALVDTDGDGAIYWIEDPEGKFGFESEGAFRASKDLKRSRLLQDGKEYFRLSGKGWEAPHFPWLDVLFPQLPPATLKEKEPRKTWPAPARTLAESLLRTEKLAKLTGGIEIVRQTQYFDVRWDDLSWRSRKLEVFSPTTWLTRSEGDNTQTIINWCDSHERGVFSKTFQLGRLRASNPHDLRSPPLELSDHSLASIEQAYPHHEVTLQPQEKERTLLVLRHPSNPQGETRVLIDTGRHVILSIEQRNGGKVWSVTRFDDFVEVAGSWWAKRIETTDSKGRRTALVTQTIKSLTADEMAQQVKRELATRDQVQFVHQPLASVTEAKRALTQPGKFPRSQAPAWERGGAEVRLVLLLHHARSQQWTRVMEQLEQAERLAAGKPGMRWLRDAVLNLSRRHEELKKRLVHEADRLAKMPAAGETDQLFLADHLRDQAAAFMPAEEMLPLLESLRPVYQRQPRYLQSMKLWQQHRVTYLHQAGEPDEALGLQKQLATENPRDSNLQQQYAQALMNVGEYEAAYAWLTRVLANPPSFPNSSLGTRAAWSADEEESLRNFYAQSLESQGRYADLADYLAKWIEQNPPNSSAYDQYLSALIRTEQVDKAHGLIARWLKEGQVKGELSPSVAARLQAAVSHALGQGYNLRHGWLDERWLAPLADTILFFARHPSQDDVANQIMAASQFTAQPQFQGSAEQQRIQQTITGLLAGELDKLTPLQIERFVNWIGSGKPAVEPRVWKQIADSLHKRWLAETKPEVKHQLGQPLVQILTHHTSAAELLAFLHLQLRQGPERHRAEYAEQLFETLLGQPWSAEYEDEALAMLDKLSNAEDADARLTVQVAGLYRLTDRMVEARFNARMKAVEHQEKLTRTELKKLRHDNLRLAREGFADRLRQETPKHAKALVLWMTIERLYLETLLERDLKQVAAECWELLAQFSRDPKGSRESAPEQELGPPLEEILRDRYLVTLAHLAARKDAEPELVTRLLKYLDQGIATQTEGNHWKLLKYRLLIALDRPKELEKVLQQWMQADDADNLWRLSLGYLLAEQGKIAPAIKLVEGIEATDELGPMAYRALADWYLVSNRRDDHERALISAYKTMEEWRLNNWLYAKLNSWRRGDGHLPGEIDKDVLLVFAALFEKGYPQNYVWQLQQFYQATHDFRLLTGLADAVIGHTAAEVYPFLQSLQPVLSEVRDEATADEIIRHLAKVRARAKTPVDRRALDLLEMLVQRRSAEVQNQPGPHVAAALAAMKRAFKGQWSAGEARLMADLLAGLGSISQPALAQEQLRELQTLHREQARGSFDRLHLAHRLANALGSYARNVEAIDLLQAELKEFQEANHGVLPVSANDALATLVSLLEGAGHYARGEKVLQDQLQHPIHQQQVYWLTQRLYQLYQHSLQNGGEVSVGAGQTLYQALERKIQGDLAIADSNHRYNLINLLCSVYRTAHEKKLSRVGDDLKTFAFKQVPQVLKGQTNNYESIVSTVAATVHDLGGVRDAIAFLLNVIENEPDWFRYNNQDGWSRHGWTIASWRVEAKNLGDLEDRLLKFVTAVLRRDLESRQPRHRALYHRQGGWYWAEKEDFFAKTAEEVLAKQSRSGAAVEWIAEYFYFGLGRGQRAIEILLAAHKQKLLNTAGQVQLVDYLQREKRFAESIVFLQPLVERQPETLDYRVRLMRAYFHTNRQADLLALLKQTDTLFHQKDRWTETVMAGLGQSCLENQLYAPAVAYYKELIPLHERTQPRRGIGNGILSGYYSNLALAYAGLHKTAEAVDASSAAIVSWGPNQTNRAQALEILKQVLRQANDLDQYVRDLDKQSAETGLQNPIVRKVLGQIYFEKEKYAQAIAQLQLAGELQPNDAETQQTLIACYDKQGDKEGAIQQLLQSVQVVRRDIKRYQELGRRLESMGQHKETERAYTSIVGVLPNESESHALLAEIREQQNRWPEAAGQWEQVARIRSLEPTGFLRLAAAQIHLQQWDKATETLRKLDSRTWPAQFVDVHNQVRALEQKIKK